ncbi:MAG: substrate-binding domain-containing protein [Clostridia bacterium]|nr:substrate-binding domain-containing protein [Clostridia bacterium]
MKETKTQHNKLVWQVILTILAIVVSGYCAFFILLLLSLSGVWDVITVLGAVLLPSLLLPLIWVKKKARFVGFWLVLPVCFIALLWVNSGVTAYQKSITVNVTPNINVREYLPFREDSKIVKIKSQTLQLTDSLPVVDGAAALFPVYSAFVNATYPETTQLYDGIFEYNNTVGGYELLGEKRIDIFFGAYPSSEQIQTAEEKGTTFCYTPIGSEAFVFFVHRENPIDSLTVEQIQKIYSGEITNWNQVGGKNEKIAAFQRNEGSGSQSMLKRFMGDIPIMEPPVERVNDLMAGIVEQVANYRSKSGSIGFSFRYYMEGIIQNPDIKLLAVDGVAPTVENIKNGSYPIISPFYAVTYEGNDNENVQKLLDWVLSEEGQTIIEQTGYTGI